MSGNPMASSIVREIDVRTIPRPQRHPLIFDAYEQLDIGQALLIISDHEPRHLRDEFDREMAGSFTWDAISTERRDHRVQITKRADTALPRVVADTSVLFENADSDASGAIWRLEPVARGLDSNIIALPPGGEIARHDGPELDVLILVLDGSGELETELEVIPLSVGELVWLPRKSRRRFTAGPAGIRYFTVHQRKPTLNITAAPTHREGA